MAAIWRRGAWACAILAAVLGAGCNLLTLPFFLFGPEPKIEAQLKKLAAEDKNKEVKVLILAYAPLEVRPEFLRVDRELSLLLARELKEGFEYNKEKVKVIPPQKVDEYKLQNPDWHTRDLDGIGADFEADYVIYLELDSISLYKKGSNNTLYQGKAQITVNLIDVHKHDDLGVKRKVFTCEFPSEARGEVPTDDVSVQDFRARFYQHIAQRLSWYFTSHPTRARNSMD